MAEANTIQWKRLSIEAVTIVASILLAFAIDAWWDYIGDRREEAELLRNLESELANNSQILTNDIKDVEDYTEAARRLLAATESVDAVSLPLESIGKDLWQTMSWRTSNLSTASLDSAINTGRLALIRDDELRTALSGWPARLSDMSEEEMFEWRHITERYRPFVGGRVKIPSLEGPDPPPLPEGASLRRLMQSDEFHSLLAMRLDVSLVSLQDKRETLSELKNLLELLRPED